jgi:hypothetical protein
MVRTYEKNKSFLSNSSVDAEETKVRNSNDRRKRRDILI